MLRLASEDASNPWETVFDANAECRSGGWDVDEERFERGEVCRNPPNALCVRHDLKFVI